MGLYFQKNCSSYTYGIWKITENLSELESISGCKPPEKISNNVRKAEFLAVRALTKILGENPENIFYKLSGRPYLENSQKNISISHTKGYVAVLLAENINSGIDIEARTERVLKIKNKFISDSENQEINKSENQVRDLLLHWCSKEAIFKATHSEGIDFKKDLIIDKFKYSGASGKFSGLFKREQQRYDLEYKTEEDFILVCCFSELSR